MSDQVATNTTYEPASGYCHPSPAAVLSGTSCLVRRASRSAACFPCAALPNQPFRTLRSVVSTALSSVASYAESLGSPRIWCHPLVPESTALERHPPLASFSIGPHASVRLTALRSVKATPDIVPPTKHVTPPRGGNSIGGTAYQAAKLFLKPSLSPSSPPIFPSSRQMATRPRAPSEWVDSPRP